MGMYSFFVDENLEVKDWDKLLEFFEWWDVYVKKHCEGYWDLFSSEKMLDKENKTITFEHWNDIKLISYWYDEYCIFLKLIAKYIDGDIEWDFECKDECGSVRFENGECLIQTGVMQYHYWQPQENIRTEMLTDEIKKRFIVDELEK